MTPADQTSNSSGEAAPTTGTGLAGPGDKRTAKSESDASEASAKGRRRAAGPPQFPNYKLLDLKPIGSGSRGKVYKAKDLVTDEIVAIKVFSSSDLFDDSMRQEVAKLIKAHGSISGFISIKKTVFDADPPYYVMPYCKDGSLQNKIDKGPLGVADSVRLFTTIVRSMASIHQKGVIHGDLKPGNILLNEAGEPLISDFGLAQLGNVRPDAYGTLYYMPPEQANPDNFRADMRWDVYALGATLYQMITGELPRRNTRLDTLLSSSTSGRGKADIYREEIQKTPLVPLRQKVRAVDKHLSRIVAHCLTIDPEKRLRDGGDLLERLLNRERRLRLRSLLVFLVIFTAVAVVSPIIGAVWISNEYFKTTTEQVKMDTQSFLRERAWIGSKLIEEKLNSRIHVVEDIARKAQHDGELRKAFENLSQAYIEQPPDQLYRAFEKSELDRLKPFETWLAKEHAAVAMKQLPYAETKRMAVTAVVQGKSYFVALTDLSIAETKMISPESIKSLPLFQSNSSWRDYFGGNGNKFDEKKDRHWPLRQTHISLPYVSETDGQSKIDISAPICFNGKDIAGFVIIGIDVRRDLTGWFRMDGSAANHLEPETANMANLIIVNDLGCPVYHSSVKPVNESNKDPDYIYRQAPWFGIDAAEFTDATDPVFPWQPVSWTYSQPVVFNVWDLDKGPQERHWWVVSEIEKAKALYPVQKLRNYQFNLALGVCCEVILVGAIAVLWTSLRILRRQTRDAHV
jgi:eukaryotic-like serine/threonine-protein kinase